MVVLLVVVMVGLLLQQRLLLVLLLLLRGRRLWLARRLQDAQPARAVELDTLGRLKDLRPAGGPQR